MSTKSVVPGGPSSMASEQTPVVTPRDERIDRAACRPVLHLINGEFYSGAERVQDLLALQLPKFGYAVDFACLKTGKFGPSRAAQDAVVHECPMTSRFDLRVVGRIVDLIQRHHYQIIHAHTPRTLMIGNLVAARRKLPLVYHVHSPASRDSTRTLMNRVNAVTERLSMTGVNQIVTVSNSLADHVVALGCDPRLVAVVPNGVPAAAPSARDTPVSPWTLSTIALFRPRKGTEVLLKAVELLRADGHNVRLRAVGSFETDEYEQHLMHLTQAYGLTDCVEWVGFRTDINQQLAQSDLFVLPSLFGEGMPMVVLESMAMGIPVIGTCVEGVPEVVRDGIDGRIAAPGDPRDLANAIDSVISGRLDWQKLRSNAIQRHREHFSDVSMAQELAVHYDNLLVPSTA